MNIGHETASVSDNNKSLVKRETAGSLCITSSVRLFRSLVTTGDSIDSFQLPLDILSVTRLRVTTGVLIKGRFVGVRRVHRANSRKEHKKHWRRCPAPASITAYPLFERLSH